jgi:hypothetical protein
MKLTTDRPLADVPCPTCKRVGTLVLGSKLVAQPIGTYSIAGAQTKLVMEEIPSLTCTSENCDFTELAKRS